MDSDPTRQTRGDVLVVDDERAIRNGIKALLEGEGYSVRTARSGAEALEAFRTLRPSLVLLDVMMPGMSGYSVCAEMRREDNGVPILFLTAKATEADELRALNLGADDFIAKTASEQIVLARVAASLRRREADERPTAPPRFAMGNAVVDAEGLCVVDSEGRRSALTVPQVALLRAMAERPGVVFPREAVVSILWPGKDDVEDSALCTAISRLRDRLGSDGRLLVSRRGVGYVFDGHR